MVFCIEQAGDFEQQIEQLGHRDLGGGAAVDRFADRADRLRKAFDRVLWRNIAGFEMHLGRAQIIAGDEAVQDLGQEPALLGAEAAHDAEVDRDEPAVGIDEEIARVHVRVKEAVAQGMAQE
jgi:hypothetical protein